MTNFSLFLLPGKHCFYSVSLTFFFFFFKIPHLSDTLQYFSFSVWLISLSVMLPGSIHVVINRTFFLFHCWIIFLYTVHTHHIIRIHLSIDAHLPCCFHILTTVNNDVRYMLMEISLWFVMPDYFVSISLLVSRLAYHCSFSSPLLGQNLRV